MGLFLAILALIVVAILATSRSVYRLRRSRVATALLSGGWLPLGIGVLLGPEVGGLIDGDVVRSATPLAVVALGWIGFAVGLQVRTQVLAAVPPVVVRVAAVDAALTTLVIGIAAGAVLAWWGGGGAAAGAIIAGVALIVTASFGWSLETRSLGGDQSEDDRALAGAIRAGGSLLIIAALIIAGLVAGLGGRGGATGGVAVVIDLALTIGVALVMGVIGKYALSLAGNDRDQQLVVFLALIALVAGVASQALVTPMFAAMVAAAVIANLQGQELRWFERFIFKGEPLIAAIVALLAGVLLEVSLTPGALVLVGVLLAARLVIKPIALAFGAGVRRSPVSLGAIRQSAIAIAIAVGLVIEDGSRFSRELLTVLVLVGFLGELIVLIATRFFARPHQTESSGEPA